MLIQGTCNSNRINILAEKYAELISKGISSDEILTIVLNSYKKAEIINEICRINPELSTEKHNIYTFFGLCYNAFKDNWDYISKLCPKKIRYNEREQIGARSFSESRYNSGQPESEYGTGTDIQDDNDKQSPNLCGLEVSQFIFKHSIKEADFSDYVSKINLLHQLFRRYSLTVQNCLTDEDVKKRSEAIGETFYIDAQRAIDDYKLKTFKYGSFDYLRQLATLPVVYNNTDYFKKIKYLMADDADELSYAFWKFAKFLVPQLKDCFIFYDKPGSSRCGYLCAYKSGINEFIKEYSPDITELKDNSVYYERAEEFFNKIKSGEKIKLCGIEYKTTLKRLDMFEDVFETAECLLKNGVKPSEIAVITPVLDEVLIQSVKKSGLKFQILSGNEKLVQNSTVKHIVTVLKLCNNLTVKDYELKNLFINLLKIPYKKCADIIKSYEESHKFPDYNFSRDTYGFAYKKFISLLNSLTETKNNLPNQIKIIYSNIIKEFENNADKEKYDFLLKEAESFENAFHSAFDNSEEEFIIQIENSVISENPADSFALDKNSIIVSSPQKIADFSIRTKYQIWIDISNGEWMKQDTGTLYNAWVLNRDWNKDEYTFEDNILLTRDKTARIVRKLMLCAKEKIYFRSSLYDNTGNENFGGLEDFILSNQPEKHEFKIIPREDQKPVLDYKKGKMGIMAVPGAGKTTILLALIIKLINDKIPPENIFVLTYMESAAKNFKERIKSAIPENNALPNISTIHGLALRIIKENANYNKAGLDENFEICDDNTKEKVLRELFRKLRIDDEKYDNYLRCITIVKLSNFKGELYSKYKEIQDFYTFFNEYNLYLKQNNLIDYDDMLCFALKILEENPEILKYYQNICKYIIEDEAQDSTEVQQRLINLLNGKYNNYIRCGDINQAITSTFTNSNTESFKNFINNNKKVEMISSQRCSEPVYSLANNLIKEALKKEETKDAFYKIEIKGTDKNPKTKNKPKYTFYNTENEEKNSVIQKVKEIMKNEPEASIAVLLRLNSQVNEYNELFLSRGMKTSVRTDCLSQKRIYGIIHSVLNTIQNPFNNNAVTELMNTYKKYGIYDFKEEDFEYIKSLKKPFMKLSYDEADSEGLLQLYWDIDYQLNHSSDCIYNSALDIGLYYSENTTDKSNSYMISTLMKRLISDTDTLEEAIKKLNYAANKPLSAYKFFEDECIKTGSAVNIMTMHKSKGDEFDYVFIPGLNEENYPVEITNVKLKSGTHYIQTIKKAVENVEIKSPNKLKAEQINETLRLLYVGFTRAKKELFVSTSNFDKRNKNIKISDFPAKIFRNE